MTHVLIKRSQSPAMFMRGAINKVAVLITAAVLLVLGGVIYLLGDPYDRSPEQQDAGTVAERLAPIGHVVVTPGAIVTPVASTAVAPPAPVTTPPVAVTPVPVTMPPVAAPAAATTAAPARALPFAPAPDQPRPTVPVLPAQTPAVAQPAHTTPPVAPAVPQMQQPPVYFRPAPQPLWMPHNAPLPQRAYPYAR